MRTQWITYNQAAERLHVSVRTIRRYVAEKRLVVRRINRRNILIAYPFRWRLFDGRTLPPLPF